MKTINWKATARTGDLMVNIRNYTSLRAVRIFLNLADTGILKNEQLVELCISCLLYTSKPMAVEYQVIIIFAATNKYLLDIPVTEITRFESELFDFLNVKYPEIPAAIRPEKVISEAVSYTHLKCRSCIRTWICMWERWMKG